MKKPTLKQKVKVYETLFSQLHICAVIALNPAAIEKIIVKLIKYGGALGNDFNGEMTDKQFNDKNTKIFNELLK
jgi:hypothetical protein